MTFFDRRFSDAQVAAVLTYIRNSWGNAPPAVTESETRRIRGHPSLPSK